MLLKSGIALAFLGYASGFAASHERMPLVLILAIAASIKFWRTGTLREAIVTGWIYFAFYTIAVFTFAIFIEGSPWRGPSAPIHFAGIAFSVGVVAFHGCILGGIAYLTSRLHAALAPVVIPIVWVLDEISRTFGGWGDSYGAVGVSVVGSRVESLISVVGIAGASVVLVSVAAAIAVMRSRRFAFACACVLAVVLSYPRAISAHYRAVETIGIVTRPVRLPDHLDRTLRVLATPEGLVGTAFDRDHWDELMRYARERDVIVAAGGVVQSGTKHPVNAALLVQPGEDLVVYVKRQLVPFGEFDPLRPVLSKFIGDGAYDSEFIRGANAAPVLADGSVSLICYEAGFSFYVAEAVRHHAKHILVLANDHWFPPGYGRSLMRTQLQAEALEWHRDFAFITDESQSMTLRQDGSRELSTKNGAIETLDVGAPGPPSAFAFAL